MDTLSVVALAWHTSHRAATTTAAVLACGDICTLPFRLLALETGLLARLARRMILLPHDFLALALCVPALELILLHLGKVLPPIYEAFHEHVASRLKEAGDGGGMH